MEPHLPTPGGHGRPRVHTLREILNAVFCIVRSGCAWRLPLGEFPPWKTVHRYIGTWRIDGTRKKPHGASRERVRVRTGRDPRPTDGPGVVDSRSVKSTGGSVGGVRREYTTAARR
ncbi:MAG: transposase [Actinomycetota bacterium]|nr:transposase [Actinomycetota bacterium]